MEYLTQSECTDHMVRRWPRSGRDRCQTSSWDSSPGMVGGRWTASGQCWKHKVMWTVSWYKLQCTIWITSSNVLPTDLSKVSLTDLIKCTSNYWINQLISPCWKYKEHTFKKKHNLSSLLCDLLDVRVDCVVFEVVFCQQGILQLYASKMRQPDNTSKTTQNNTCTCNEIITWLFISIWSNLAIKNYVSHNDFNSPLF